MLVTLLCPTLCEPMDCNLPGSSVHGILQTRTQEWVVIPFQGKGTNDPLYSVWYSRMRAWNELAPTHVKKLVTWKPRVQTPSLDQNAAEGNDSYLPNTHSPWSPSYRNQFKGPLPFTHSHRTPGRWHLFLGSYFLINLSQCSNLPGYQNHLGMPASVFVCLFVCLRMPGFDH